MAANEQANHENGDLQPQKRRRQSPSNTVTVILGSQWGDEGKGKIVDLLATDADVVCRCQVCMFPIDLMSSRNSKQFFEGQGHKVWFT